MSAQGLEEDRDAWNALHKGPKADRLVYLRGAFWWDAERRMAKAVPVPPEALSRRSTVRAWLCRPGLRRVHPGTLTLASHPGRACSCALLACAAALCPTVRLGWAVALAGVGALNTSASAGSAQGRAFGLLDLWTGLVNQDLQSDAGTMAGVFPSTCRPASQGCCGSQHPPQPKL